MSIKKFTGLDGKHPVWVDTDRVLVITTMGLNDPKPGAPVIIMVGGQMIPVNAGIGQVLATMGKMARFTGMESRGIWVNPQNVIFITVIMEGDQDQIPKGNRVKIGTPQIHMMGGLSVSVQNTKEEVVAGLGGSLIELASAA